MWGVESNILLVSAWDGVMHISCCLIWQAVMWLASFMLALAFNNPVSIFLCLSNNQTFAWMEIGYKLSTHFWDVFYTVTDQHCSTVEWVCISYNISLLHYYLMWNISHKSTAKWVKQKKLWFFMIHVFWVVLCYHNNNLSSDSVWLENLPTEEILNKWQCIWTRLDYNSYFFSKAVTFTIPRCLKTLKANCKLTGQTHNTWYQRDAFSL